ncbi:uncharacterized protein LOC134471880 [Cavia porcellus]|uniref:uncharacterized protein LOC134471880 n=1 Tax=Cavia porcellus TaxID=10141 RepID=UPI002FE0940C
MVDVMGGHCYKIMDVQSSSHLIFVVLYSHSSPHTPLLSVSLSDFLHLLILRETAIILPSASPEVITTRKGRGCPRSMCVNFGRPLTLAKSAHESPFCWLTPWTELCGQKPQLCRSQIPDPQQGYIYHPCLSPQIWNSTFIRSVSHAQSRILKNKSQSCHSLLKLSGAFFLKLQLNENSDPFPHIHDSVGPNLCSSLAPCLPSLSLWPHQAYVACISPFLKHAELLTSGPLHFLCSRLVGLVPRALLKCIFLALSTRCTYSLFIPPLLVSSLFPLCSKITLFIYFILLCFYHSIFEPKAFTLNRFPSPCFRIFYLKIESH